MLFGDLCNAAYEVASVGAGPLYCDGYVYLSLHVLYYNRFPWRFVQTNCKKYS